MRTTSPWSTLALLCLTLAFPRPAGADPVQVFVEDLKVELDGWDARQAEALGKALAADLQGAIVKNPAYVPMTYENLESQLRKEKRAEQLSCSKSDQACIQKILDNYGCEERLYGTVRQVGNEAQVSLTRYRNEQLVGNGAASDYAKPEAKAIREAATRLAMDLFGGPRSSATTATSGAAQAVTGQVSVGQAFDRGQAIQNAFTDDAGFLTITTEPSGATLFLNGKEIGTSPKQLETMVGKYVVAAELGRLYHPGRQDVNLTTAGADVKLVLPAAFGSLDVTSTPPGAEVWLGNERVGTTPYKDERRISGSYPLRVTLGRYVPVEETVVVEDGKATSKVVRLEADFGELSVKSTPDGAAVWLNGEQVGTTPWESGPRAVGTYEVRIVAPLHLSYTEKVELRRGDTRSVDAGLQANYGALQVSSEPAGVAITLNNTPTGFATPHAFERLETGTYTIELSQEGYGDVADRATVTPLSTASAHLVLQAKLGMLSVMAAYDDGALCSGTVTIDGAAAGTTPLKVQVPATEHEVTVTCEEGARTERVRVEHNQRLALDWTIAKARRVVRASQTARAPAGVAMARMVAVNAGEFWMGCNPQVDTECEADEKPGRKVNVPAYRIDEHEVTIAEYGACVAAGACANPNSSGSCNWGHSERHDHPVNCVNWTKAKTYCEWAGKRLPTEVEWEKAARGTDGRKYPWGNQPASCDLAVLGDGDNVDGCGEGGTWPVCSKEDGNSPSGLCDVAGNVWEWLEDGYSATASSNGAPSEANGSTAARVVRGGSWVYVNAPTLRASDRDWNPMGGEYFHVGFRCAASGVRN